MMHWPCEFSCLVFTFDCGYNHKTWCKFDGKMVGAYSRMLHPVGDRNNKVAIFTHPYLCDVYPNGTKFTVELASIWGGHVSNFNKIPQAIPEIWVSKIRKISLFFFFFVILHTLQNRYNSCMRASVWLKFGTRIGGLKANASIDFGVNLIKTEGVISNFTHTSKSNFCQAYRVKHFKEQAENRYVTRLNIRGVPFGG